MKHQLVLLVALSLTLSLSAQKSKVVSAHNYLRYGELDKAKEAIDAAALDETTSQMAKTWLYKGNIYLQISQSQDAKYNGLSENAISEAYTSYTKAYEFDTKKIDINELNQALASCVPPLFSKGVEKFNQKDYTGAVALFENCVAINQKFNHTDTLSLYNAAIASERSENYDKAIEFYTKCKELNYGGSKIYANIADVYKLQKKDKEAMAIIKEGRTKYPNDQDLVTAEINFFLKNENFQEALGNLDIAIQNDPANPTFYFARGSIQDQQGMYEKAEADYLKAIEVKSDFFDAVYNLGALHFNRGAEVYNKANELPLKEVKQAAEMRTQAEELFKKALPYLEKAEQLSPNDKGTLLSLKNIYARTGETEKYNVVNEKLKN